VENQNTKKKIKTPVAFTNYPSIIPQGTQTGPKVNLALCSKRPATNCPSHGMALSEQMSKFCTWKIILCTNKSLKISCNEVSLICNSNTRQKIKTLNYHYYRIL